MIGDKLTYHSEYKEITGFVISKLSHKLNRKHRICISVAGESGCGKTSLAYALQQDIEKSTGLKGMFFHMDDYFKLPPADNHNARLNNIGAVGKIEVNLHLLDNHLIQFQKETNILNKPLVDYHQNLILNEHIISKDFDFCLVEGTYVNCLKAPDYKIFIETTYLDTRKSRIERARDVINDFNEEVLEIEHHIISKQKGMAHVIVDKNLKLTRTN